MSEQKPRVLATTEGDNGEPHGWWVECRHVPPHATTPEYDTWREAMDHALTCTRPTPIGLRATSEGASA